MIRFLVVWIENFPKSEQIHFLFNFSHTEAVVPLPTKKLRVTTRKSPDGEGTETWERYEMRIHKRLIDLGIDERALRLVMRVNIPDGLNIEIEMVDI